MKLIEWQFYWPKWGLGCVDFEDAEFGLSERIVVIGPLQLRFWMSNV